MFSDQVLHPDTVPDKAATDLDYISELLQSCWRQNPSQRPSSQEVVERLSALLPPPTPPGMLLAVWVYVGVDACECQYNSILACSTMTSGIRNATRQSTALPSGRLFTAAILRLAAMPDLFVLQNCFPPPCIVEPKSQLLLLQRLNQ